MSNGVLGQGTRDKGQEREDRGQERVKEKLHQVKETIAGFGRVIVAFSGGVDSTVLAVLAQEVLGRDHVLAVTADSPSLSRADLEEAVRLARQRRLRHLVIPTHEVADSAYRANTEARCYICKHTLFEELEELAKARQIPVVLYGAIGDDQPAERPGQQAALQFGVRAPLQEVGLAKWEIRELAKRLGLANWDRPQNACLSSRIPHGDEVNEQKLGQVERAEALLRAEGFRQVRVRHLGTHARIEVGRNEISRFQDACLCQEIARRFETLGFATIGVDRAGYRSGGADTTPSDEVLLTAISKC